MTHQKSYVTTILSLGLLMLGSQRAMAINTEMSQSVSVPKACNALAIKRLSASIQCNNQSELQRQVECNDLKNFMKSESLYLKNKVTMSNSHRVSYSADFMAELLLRLHTKNFLPAESRVTIFEKVRCLRKFSHRITTELKVAKQGAHYD